MRCPECGTEQSYNHNFMLFRYEQYAAGEKYCQNCRKRYCKKVVDLRSFYERNADYFKRKEIDIIRIKNEMVYFI